MDAVEKTLLRVCELSLEDHSEENDAELGKLLPPLVEAGYVHEEPWGDDPAWFLWRFTEAGIARAKTLGCF